MAAHRAQRGPHSRPQINVGGAVSDLSAVEPCLQEIQPRVDAVASGEAFGAHPIALRGEDRIALGGGHVLEVAGGRDIGQGSPGRGRAPGDGWRIRRKRWEPRSRRRE